MTNGADCFGESKISPRNDSKNSPSLAEGDKGGGLKAQNNSSAKFSNNKSTHPLAPSAREGESAELPHAREGESMETLRTMEGNPHTTHKGIQMIV